MSQFPCMSLDLSGQFDFCHSFFDNAFDIFGHLIGFQGGFPDHLNFIIRFNCANLANDVRNINHSGLIKKALKVQICLGRDHIQFQTQVFWSRNAHVF